MTVRLVAITELEVSESIIPGMSWKVSESRVAGLDIRVSTESS